jgi:hypothetical protein
MVEDVEDLIRGETDEVVCSAKEREGMAAGLRAAGSETLWLVPKGEGVLATSLRNAAIG